MFGAPDLTRRPAFSHREPIVRRRPGIGDHVCACGGYVGLIVDLLPGGIATVARRAQDSRAVVESDKLVDTLTISPVTPIAFDEVFDRLTWTRGALG